jgi:hypothetical protein
MKRFISTLKALFWLLLPALTWAQNSPELKASEPSHGKPLWVNAGFYTHHFDPDLHLRDNNLGLGLEYRYRPDQAWTAGMYQNSNWQNSRYLGWYWQPWQWGPVKAGAVIGVFDGYPNANGGGIVPGLIPTLTAEYERVGLNVLFVPGYKDQLSTSISFQLKFKVKNF